MTLVSKYYARPAAMKGKAGSDEKSDKRPALKANGETL
jgi:hypothetical protein